MNEDAPQVPAETTPGPAPVAPPPLTENVAKQGAPTVPAAGKRSSFRDIRRQLTEEELKQTGVQKLLIEDFERAEADCEALRGYVEKFYDSDKRLGIATEQLKVARALEIITGVGLVGGGAIISLAPSFWAVNTFKGYAAIIVGALFIAGAIAAKVTQRSK